MGGRYQYPLRVRNLAYSAALIAVLWASPWLLWRGAAARPVPRRAAGAPLRVVYMGTMRESATTLSPLAFALPTPWGFRPADRTNGPSALAPARPPDMAAYLGSAARPAAAAPWRPAEAAPLDGAQDGTAWRAADGPTLAGASVPGGGTNTWRWIDPALAARRFAFDVPVPAAATNALGTGWLAAQATVELDAAGGVAHVWLDPPAGRPDWDAALARALRAGRAAAGAAPVRGTVRVAVPAP